MSISTVKPLFKSNFKGIVIKRFLYQVGIGTISILTVGDLIGTFRHPYGPSMLPTMNIANDVVFVERWSLWRKNRGCKVGDIVAFSKPTDPSMSVSKRILGMWSQPGDVVCVDPTLIPSEREYYQIPEGHFWASGDNLSNSTDSRVYGPVPLGLVEGKLLFRIWPNWTWFTNANRSILPTPKGSQD